MLAPWATISCCSGSSHCSALCNYTVHNRALPFALSFCVTFSFVFHCSSSSPMLSLLFNACFADRGPAGGEGCSQTAVFVALFLFTRLVRFVYLVQLIAFHLYYLIMPNFLHRSFRQRFPKSIIAQNEKPPGETLLRFSREDALFVSIIGV